ncbi:MAG TPA: hypothetical protein PKK60_03565 [archaeon]|nr:hypothetical protein [archaeon]
MSTQVLPKSFFLIGISPNPTSWEKIKQYLYLYSHKNKKVGLDISETQLKKIKSLPEPTHMDYIGNPKLALAREIINYAKKQKLNIIPLKTPRANNRRVSEENEWIHSRTIKEKDNQVSEYLIESGMRMRVKKQQPKKH